MIFGLLFAFGFLHREFTLFAVIAIVLLEAWTGELFSRRRAAHWLVVVLVFLGSRQTVTLLRHTASMFGPDAAPPRLEDGITNVDLVARSVCLSPGPMLGNLWWLIAHNVPTFFGVQAQPAGRADPVAAAHRRAVGGVARASWRWRVRCWSWRLARWRWLPPLRAPADSRVLLPTMLCVHGAAEPGRRRDWLQRPEPVHDPLSPAAGVRAGGADGAGLCAGRPALTDPGPSASAARARAGTRVVLPLMTAAVLVWAAAMLRRACPAAARVPHEPAGRARIACLPTTWSHTATSTAGPRTGCRITSTSCRRNACNSRRRPPFASPTTRVRRLRAGRTAVVVGSEPCSSGEAGRQVAVWWVCGGT